MKPLILVVEDEAPLIEMLRYNLEKTGHRTCIATDGVAALEQIDLEQPDLIVLDWMLPRLSGIEVCRRLRADPYHAKLPIIMLTARGEEEDRVRGLEGGADDYIVKPFSPSELIARIRSVLRRSGAGLPDERLQYRDIVMDLATHKVKRGPRAIHLGPTEFRLLHVLMKRPGRVLSRGQLLDLAWGRDKYLDERTVDVHVRRLRKALNDSGQIDVIRTVRGAGYALDSEKT